MGKQGCMRSRLLLLALLIAILLAGCIHTSPASDTDTDGNGTTPENTGTDGSSNASGQEACLEDVESAIEASEDADACTEESAEMQCPHDDSVTYSAADGCEISTLEERGWERVKADRQDTNDTNTTDGSDLDPVRVAVDDNTFDPETIEAAPNQTIVFENVGDNDHTVTIDGLPINETLTPGDRYRLSLPKEDTYNLNCRFHDGMDGEIIIEG